MATAPAPAPAPSNIDTLLKLAADLPELAALVQAAVAAAQAEKTATTIVEHLKIAEPVLEAAAALGDKIVAQLGGK